MSKTVIKIENLSKIYRLGEVGTGTISHDLNRWWRMNILGQDDPYAKIGHVNDRTAKAEKGELVAALRDINLEVKEGEVLGIIGRNGAGKSTLLKILSRVTSPTTGSIKVSGRMASLLEVGTGFHQDMSGRENIYMNGTIMGMRKWEITRKLDEIVEFAGVAKYLDTPVKRYSSGMTVRLGFAIAAYLEPEILIVDEVLAVGDAEFQKKAIGKMQDVSANDGRTVLFVSHNMGAIANLCNKAAIMDKGSLYFNGDVQEAIKHYKEQNNTKNSLNYTKKGCILKKVEIVNNEGQILTLVKNFTPIAFRIIIETMTKVDGKIKGEIYIKNSYDEVQATLSSWINEESLNIQQENNFTLTCKLPLGVPLDNGTFMIDLRIFINYQQIDFENIISFEVVNSPLDSNTKHPLKPFHGGFIIKNYWFKS